MMPISAPRLLEPGSPIPATQRRGDFDLDKLARFLAKLPPMKTSQLIIAMLAFLCLLAAGPQSKAVVPPPDGGYPNFTTAEGPKALFSLTTGAANTAVGWSYALYQRSAGSFNTAIGAGALLFNAADSNTATGAAALLLNTTGTQQHGHWNCGACLQRRRRFQHGRWFSSALL